MNASPPDHGPGRALREPAWLAAPSLCGLMLALLGDGWFDVVGYRGAGPGVAPLLPGVAGRNFCCEWMFCMTSPLFVRRG